MRRIVLVVAVLFLAGCASAPRMQPADLILTGARIFTGDDARPWAEAVAIRGETIAAVGADAEVRALAGAATRVVDLGGKLVIPGINDAHLHAPWLSEVAPYMVDEGTSIPIAAEGATKASVLAALRDGAANAPPGGLVRAELPIHLVFAGITRDDLDAISTAHRILLAPLGGHSAVLNTPALRAWGIEETDADPVGGWYGRAHGRLDGWLYEHAYWIPQIRDASAVADARYLEAIRDLEDEALRLGITSLQTIPFIAPERLESLLASAGARLRWRILDLRMAPWNGRPGRFPVKVIADGTPIERSAALREPYLDDRSTSGRVNYEPSEIEAMVRDAARGGWQLHVHASGDRTAAAVLEAMRRTPADWPARRLRIEHGDGLSADLRALARDLGVVVVENPSHFMLAELIAQRLGARAAEYQPARSLLEDGIPFALGSDGPLNPYLNMFFAAIHPTNPKEALTVEQSLRAYTSGAAFAEFEEGRKGTIAPGMLADLAVLSQDIFAVPPQQLPATTSVMTIVGGKVVFEQ